MLLSAEYLVVVLVCAGLTREFNWSSGISIVMIYMWLGMVSSVSKDVVSLSGVKSSTASSVGVVLFLMNVFAGVFVHWCCKFSCRNSCLSSCVFTTILVSATVGSCRFRKRNHMIATIAAIVIAWVVKNPVNAWFTNSLGYSTRSAMLDVVCLFCTHSINSFRFSFSVA